MMSWLRKEKRMSAFDEELAESREAMRTESDYMPASMRPRPIVVPPAVHEDLDEDDEQVALFASLAEQVHRDAASRDGAPERAGRTSAARETDELWAFRDRVDASDPYEGVRRHVDHDVAIDELLDELSVTAAALRQRRAA